MILACIPRLLLVALIALLALAPLASTSAAQPTRETVSITRNFGVVGSCDDFDVRAVFYVTRHITTFYDQEGNPVRRHVHVEIPGTYTNTVTGKTLQTTGLRNIFFDLTDGTVKSNATNVHVVVPGMGTVMLAAGMFITEDGELVKEVGRLDPPVTPEVCEALS